MHDATIVMKDGKEYCAPIWTFVPARGCLTLVDVPEILYFRDMVSAKTMTRLTVAGELEEVDLLSRARKEGWDGA